MTAARMDVLEVRTDRLEQNLAQLAANVDRVSANIDRVSANLERYAREAREEMRAHREQVQQEMHDYREEARKRDAAMRQSIAEVSHKMGTMAEDLIAPSVPRILKQVLHCDDEPVMLGVRIRKRLPDGRSQEYDVIAVANDYLLVNETKNRLRPEDVGAFVRMLGTVREFLPEYADKKIIGALASFYVDPTLVAHGTRHGLIMLGVTDGMMEPLNGDGFMPKEY